MTAHEIICLVRDVRSAQKLYFRTRDFTDLKRSRAMEDRLDKAINDYFNHQTTIFENIIGNE